MKFLDPNRLSRDSRGQPEVASSKQLFCYRKKPGKNWILLRKIKKADESLVGPILLPWCSPIPKNGRLRQSFGPLAAETRVQIPMGAFIFMENLPITFEDAKNEKGLRQLNLYQVESAHPINGLHGIIYKDEPGRIAFRVVPYKLRYTKSGFSNIPDPYRPMEYVTIEAYNFSFDFCRSEGEFLSMLVDHEYEHVRQITQGFQVDDVPGNLLNEFDNRVLRCYGDLTRIFGELEAYSKEIARLGRRNVSQEFSHTTHSLYSSYREALKSKERGPLIAWILNRFPDLGIIVN